MNTFIDKQNALDAARSALEQRMQDASNYLEGITSEQKNPSHIEDFNALLNQAASDSPTADQT